MQPAVVFLLSGSQVPTSSKSDVRPLAHRVLLLQTGTGLAVALVCLAFWGRSAFMSALAGAFAGVIANLYMTFWALRPARTTGGALGRLYVGQLIKVAVTVALFYGALRVPHVSWRALLAAYVATFVVCWWVPFAAARARTEDRG